MPPRKTDTASAALPNAGLEREYRRRLQALIDEMASSTRFWVLARYREYLPKIVTQAADASPTSALEKELNEVIRGWSKHYNTVGRELAKWFASRVNGNATRSWSQSLKDAGFAFKMTTSRRTKDVLRAIVKENVSLIKSIPEKYFSDVEQLVMRSVSKGGDLGGLADKLQERYKVTRARAVVISKDQNAKATGNITRSRNLDMGITEGIWMHRSGPKKPRDSHAGEMNGQTFSLTEGLYDPDEGYNVMPGELVNCGCVYRPVLPVAGGRNEK